MLSCPRGRGLEAQPERRRTLAPRTCADAAGGPSRPAAGPASDAAGVSRMSDGGGDSNAAAGGVAATSQ